MEEVKCAYYAMKPCWDSFTVGQLAKEMTLLITSPAARSLILGLIELRLGKTERCRHFMGQAEYWATAQERACVMHVEALQLFIIGDEMASIEKDKACLEICGPQGNKWLRGKAMWHLSGLYGVLGNESLAKSYAEEAWKLWPQ